LHRWHVMTLQRLKTRPQFQAVLAGKTLVRTQHFALHSCALEPVPPMGALFSHPAVWMGAMVPKRWAKRAVTRNTIKRQIYNVSAVFATSLPQRAHVVRLRCAFDRIQFPSASSDALRTAVRAELFQLFSVEMKPANSAPASALVTPLSPPPT